MSAFLYFSQGKRRTIKDANPSMKNTEVSRMLGEMWRNAPEEERKPHIDKEKEEREKYKVAIADWRKEFEAKMEKERKAQADQAAYMANMYQNPPGGDPHQQQQHAYGDPNMMAQYPGQQQGPPNMGPPPPGQGYGYGAPMYSYGKSSGSHDGVGFSHRVVANATPSCSFGLCSIPPCEPLSVPHQWQAACHPWSQWNAPIPSCRTN